MYEELNREIETFKKRTPRSLAAHQKAAHHLPLGVGSDFRIYEPYPIFWKDGYGSRMHDLDGNEYIDFNMCFGALMSGHCHPAVVRAVEGRLKTGTAYGMPHELEDALAQEIIARFPVDLVRFGSTGTEATMHSIRLSRGATGRNKIIKAEGCYHGVHDAVMVGVKPKADTFGPADAPNSVPSSAGIPADTANLTLIVPFNDLDAVERRFKQNPNQVACVIVEPIMMNVGICMPEPGYLQGLRELCTRYGAFLIFDEVKTGGKLCRGGACEYFNVTPDIVCLAKSIGGGFPISAFGARKDLMDNITQHKVFHAGTFNTNPLVMAASLATFREVLTPDNYAKIERLNQRLVNGTNDILKKNGISGYCIGCGANGALMLYPKPIRNYRDWLTIDIDLWRHYWFAMVNRGVLPQAHWWDEQWTMSVAHTEAEIDRNLEVFAEIAPALARAQKARATAAAH